MVNNEALTPLASEPVFVFRREADTSIQQEKIDLSGAKFAKGFPGERLDFPKVG